MSRYGKYDPADTANSSSLFVYKEVPVPSQKLNRWNGNLLAGFDLLHSVCRSLIAQGQACVLSEGNANALQAVPASPPDMTVRLQPGWAVLPDGIAGLTSEASVPLAGSISAPESNSRIDLIVLYKSGAVEILTGDENVSPIAPATPDDAIALAQIVHRVGSTAIHASDTGSDSYLVDQRPPLTVAKAHRHNDDLRPADSCDGSRTLFSTTYVYRPESLDVFLNGVLQEADQDYTLQSNGKSYSFLHAPKANSRIQHRYQPLYTQS